MNRINKNRCRVWLAAALCCLGAGAAGAAEVRVVTTLPSFADIVRKVGGDRVEVQAICKGYEDPHYLQAKPSYARSLRKADLLVYNGLDLEAGWLPPLLETSRNPKLAPGSTGLLEASIAVERKLEVPAGEVSRAQGDIHPFGNPHFMLDPRNGLAVADLVARRLSELDPSGAAMYETNRAAFRARLEAKIAGWETALAPIRDEPVVAYHKQWEYLNDWSGLRLVDYVESKPGIPPTPRHVEGLVDQMKKDKVRLVMAATFTDEEAATKIAERGGATFILLPAEVGGMDGTDTYIALMDLIVNTIVHALAGN